MRMSLCVSHASASVVALVASSRRGVEKTPTRQARSNSENVGTKASIAGLRLRRTCEHEPHEPVRLRGRRTLWKYLHAFPDRLRGRRTEGLAKPPHLGAVRSDERGRETRGDDPLKRSAVASESSREM